VLANRIPQTTQGSEDGALPLLGGRSRILAHRLPVHELVFSVPGHGRRCPRGWALLPQGGKGWVWWRNPRHCLLGPWFGDWARRERSVACHSELSPGFGGARFGYLPPSCHRRNPVGLSSTVLGAVESSTGSWGIVRLSRVQAGESGHRLSEEPLAPCALTYTPSSPPRVNRRRRPSPSGARKRHPASGRSCDGQTKTAARIPCRGAGGLTPSKRGRTLRP
jgi:hypothetical protein